MTIPSRRRECRPALLLLSIELLTGADLYLGAPRHRWAWAAVAAWAPSLHLGPGSARVAGDVGSLLLTSRASPFAPLSPGADARGRAFAKRRLAG